jgi:threonine synthase
MGFQGRVSFFRVDAHRRIRFRHSPEKISGGDPMVFVITAQTKKDSQAAHTDFTRSVYMESDTQPDNQTVLNKWKQKYGDDVDENTLEIEPLKDMDADKLRAGGLEVSKI